MPKRKQKRKGGSEEKRRAEGTSSSRERTDLREFSPFEQFFAGTPLQVVPYRDWFTGIITSVSPSLQVYPCGEVPARARQKSLALRLSTGLMAVGGPRQLGLFL
jgi:hypothetical protein